MRPLETNIAYLPLAYQCAIEMLNNGERSTARISGLFEHFETAYGLQSRESAEMLQCWRESAIAIARRRYWNFDA
jgi:hypothetical protein